jgi:proteasome assembly chaperone (PAC2) family protein
VEFVTFDLVDPWLVATWPGMGSVALGAGQYLRDSLHARHLQDLPAEEFFDVEKVEIQDGLARVGWLPGCSLYGWKNSGPGRDLLLFIGEAQPGQRAFEFGRELLKTAEAWGVRRVFTFAAMATQIHPQAAPRVFAVANETDLLPELARQEVEVLREGQISGLNGVLLAAAAERNIEAFCLLGEMPFFAVSVPNPKASAQVLQIFTRMAEIDLDFRSIDSQSREVEARLSEALDRMNIGGEGGTEGVSFTVSDYSVEEAGDDKKSGLTPKEFSRIEAMFRRATSDRAKAVELKTELDRLGVFNEFEDRFLDLFKRGEPG